MRQAYHAYHAPPLIGCEISLHVLVGQRNRTAYTGTRSTAPYTSDRYAWMEYFTLINRLAASVNQVTLMASDRAQVKVLGNGRHANLGLKSDHKMDHTMDKKEESDEDVNKYEKKR